MEHFSVVKHTKISISQENGYCKVVVICKPLRVMKKNLLKKLMFALYQQNHLFL